MKQLLWFIPLALVVLFITITIVVMNQEQLPLKSELYTIDGYLFYTDSWIFYEQGDAEVVEGELQINNKDAFIRLWDKRQLLQNYSHGDYVRIWHDGIRESYPPSMTIYYIEERD